jgi:hypothetical protein
LWQDQECSIHCLRYYEPSLLSGATMLSQLAKFLDALLLGTARALILSGFGLWARKHIQQLAKCLLD